MRGAVFDGAGAVFDGAGAVFDGAGADFDGAGVAAFAADAGAGDFATAGAAAFADAGVGFAAGAGFMAAGVSDSEVYDSQLPLSSPSSAATVFEPVGAILEGGTVALAAGEAKARAFAGAGAAFAGADAGAGDKALPIFGGAAFLGTSL